MTTSAREQSSHLADLLRREHGALADFLVALAAFDQARGWVELGYASLFNYLHHDLGLSKGAAFYRMTAARLVQEHPEVVEPLADGRLCLTTVVSLAKALTAGQLEDVLPRFFGLSTREAKAVTAELIPAAVVPSRVVITAVSTPTAPPALAPPMDVSRTVGQTNSRTVGQTNQPAELSHLVGQANLAPAPGSPPRPPTPVLVEEPKTAELSRIHVTVPRRFLKKLEVARAALSHSHPGASEDEVLELGLDLVIQRHARRRGLVENPRRPRAKAMGPSTACERETSPEPSSARLERQEPLSVAAGGKEQADVPGGPSGRGGRRREHIPVHVKRAVWMRDGGRCQWPVEGGGVCGSTLRVEIDHVVPVALGGPSTVENCRLACGFHNDHAARQVFGDDHIDQFTARGRTTKGARPSVRVAGAGVAHS